MDADLSRRAGVAMSTPLFLALSFDERQQFVLACTQAKTFQDLPKEWQQKIIQSEK